MGVTFTAIRTPTRTGTFGVFSAHNLLSRSGTRINMNPTIQPSAAIRTG